MEQLLRTLLAFVNADTWAESRRIIEEHPELLGQEADVLLGRLIQAQEDEGDRRYLEEHRAILARCREVGVDRAFAEHVGAQHAAPTIPPAFQADLRQAQEAEARYLQSSDRRALDEAVAAWERILRHPAFASADGRFQLAAMNNAGGAFLRRYWARGNLADLNRALDLCRRAVQLTPQDSPDLPGFLNNLALGLRERYARTGDPSDLEEPSPTGGGPSNSPHRIPQTCPCSSTTWPMA